MSRQQVTLDMLEKERDSIFDDYYTLIEKVRLKFIQDGETGNEDHIIDLKKALTMVDRNLQDVSTDKKIIKNKVTTINNTVIVFLKEWFPILSNLISESEFAIVFGYNLLALATLINESRNLNELDFRKDIISLEADIPKYPYGKSRYSFRRAARYHVGTTNVEGTLSPISHAGYGELLAKALEELKKAVSQKEIVKEQLLSRLELAQNILLLENAKSADERHSHYASDLDFTPAEKIYNNYEKAIFPSRFSTLREVEDIDLDTYREKLNSFGIHDVLEKIRQIEYDHYLWNISVVIDGKEFQADKIAFLMWSLSNSLKSIDGVEVELENWGNGSKFFNLLVRIKNVFAKKEVKDLLEKGRKAAESYYIDKPIVEVEKIKAENLKTKKETETMLSKGQVNELYELDIRKRELELEGLKADVALKKLSAIKGYSELIKEGIIMNDANVRIIINDLMYLSKVGNDKLRTGEHMDLIEEKEIKKEKEEPNQDEGESA